MARARSGPSDTPDPEQPDVKIVVDGATLADAVADNLDAIRETPDGGAALADVELTPLTDLTGREAAVYERGWKAGYQAAVEARKPPLFEACKQAAFDHYMRVAVKPGQIHELIDEIETGYDEKLSDADRNLIVGAVLRLQPEPLHDYEPIA